MGPLRLQFRMREMMIAVAIVAAVLAFLCLSMSNVAWIGGATVPLEFLVLDSETGQPVNGASIRLVEGNPGYRATSGPDGRAKLVIQATAAGQGAWPWRGTRAVYYWHWWLVVSADDYQRFEDDLSKLTMDDRYHHDAVPPPIVIRLKRLMTP